MKLLLRFLLVAAIWTPLFAQAGLVFYKGTRRDTYIGEGRTLVVNWKMVLLVDHETARAVRVQYATIYGAKHYSASWWTNTHFVQVTGARGNSTAIAQPPTQCEMDSGATGESVYCHGVNAALTINTNSTILFPRILSDRGNGLSYSQSSGQPVIAEGAFQLVFDRAGTLASNQAGETLDDAVLRLFAHVETLGYTR